MSGPLCKYPPCSREIIQGQWGAEGDEPFAERLAEGYCRSKCRRLHGPQKSERGKPTLALISSCYESPEGVEQPKEARIVDLGYESWVRSFPCLVPGCIEEAQSHHQNERGKGGKSTKPSSYRCLPLCPGHHTLGGTPHLPGSYHGMGKLTGWKFWQHYGIDVEATIHNLNRLWLESGKRFKE
jgi:hypothetical protein